MRNRKIRHRITTPGQTTQIKRHPVKRNLIRDGTVKATKTWSKNDQRKGRTKGAAMVVASPIEISHVNVLIPATVGR